MRTTRRSREWTLTLALATVACGGPVKDKAKNAFGHLGQIINGGGGGGGAEATDPPAVNKPYPQFQLTLESYSDCSALQADVRARLSERREEEKAYRAWQEAQQSRWEHDGVVMADAASSAKSSAGSIEPEAASEGGTDGQTNVQEKGVDEADTFKIGERHIFAVQDSKIQVVGRTGLNLLGALDLDGLIAPTLYAQDGRLIVVGQRLIPEANCSAGTGTTPGALMSSPSSTPACSSTNDAYYRATAPADTEVRIYDASGDGLPTLTGTRKFSGRTFDSRLTAGRLVLVFSDYLWVDDPAFPASAGAYGFSPWMYGQGDLDAPVPDAPVRLDADGRVGGIPCNALLKQQVRDFDFRLTKVVTLDPAKPDAPEQAAGILGGGDQIYMSLDGLYVAKSDVSWYWWAPYEENAHPEQLIVTRVKFDRDTGAVTPEAAGAVDGRIKDQWAFKEFADQGVLAVATSTGVLWDGGEQKAQNHLWILKPNGATGNLDVAASLQDFGTGEDIRAVRYVGNTAYVVTFKKTDPLFAIDLNDALHPKLLGELQVPGFSVYLHPVSPTRLVGLGFDADDQGDFAWYQGLQVSLFDVADPLHLKRLDNHVLGSRGSYSDATGDHHAFFFDPETMLVGMPVVQLGGAQGGPEMGDHVDFSGAVLYKVGDNLTEAARISHQDLVPAVCKAQLAYGHWWQDKAQSLDVNRVFKVDGRILSLSRFGLKAHDAANPAVVTATVQYPAGDAECPQAGMYYD